MQPTPTRVFRIALRESENTQPDKTSDVPGTVLFAIVPTGLNFSFLLYLSRDLVCSLRALIFPLTGTLINQYLTSQLLTYKDLVYRMSAPIPQPPGYPILGNIDTVDPSNAMLSLVHLAEKYGKLHSKHWRLAGT